MATASQDSLALAARVCVVTGGGTGIGRAIALALAAEGAAVAILDRDETAAQATLDLVSRAGAEGLAITCDVSSQDSVEAACDAVRKRFGDAQVLVNNAAIRRPGPLQSLSLCDWNALLSVNLTGYFICAQTFGRAMLANGDGALVHISSQAADFAHPFSGAYSVAKAGVSMLSRLLAVEWAPAGVRSNAVHPGFVDTSQPMYDQPGVRERRSAAVPVGRIGRPEDTAQAVVFLASSRSSYVNGIELAVDGGFTRNLMSLVRARALGGWTRPAPPATDRSHSAVLSALRHRFARPNAGTPTRAWRDRAAARRDCRRSAGHIPVDRIP
jgi:NAD(P)-dependent dehydrogenase (short-subunit alcohol dehydrogenase family)